MTVALDSLGNLTLSDVCDGAAILDEGNAGFVDSTVEIPGIDGRKFDPDAPHAPLTLMVEFIPKYVDSGGNAGFGHVNLSAIKKELASRTEVALVRTIDNIGQIRAMVKQFAPMSEQRPSVYVASLTCPSGSWQDNAESDSGAASTSPSVTTEGDRDIFDPIIEFQAAGTLTHTHTVTGEVATVEALSGPVFPVTVWIAGKDSSSFLYAEDDTGDDVTGKISLSQSYGLRFEPDATLNLASTSNVIVKWRNRHG